MTTLSVCQSLNLRACAATDMQRLQIERWRSQADALLESVRESEALISAEDEPPQVQVLPLQ